MKKYYIFAGIALLAASPGFAQIKIGATGAPDGSAMLEVTSGTANNKGLLPPRMTTVQRDAITSPATGLLIYNTTANEVQVNTGTAAAANWTAATADNAGWSTTGNTGTDAASSFIGTTDNQPLAFRTNDTEAMRVTANGRIGIGTNAPVAKLQVVDTGNAAIVVTSSDDGKTSFNLGNINHGITRDLTDVGGVPNDVALFTTMANANDPASIHLTVRKDVNDTLDMNQFVLKNTGNVGIGTNEPVVKLQVVDTANAAIIVSNVDGSSKTSVYLGNENHGITRDLSEVGGKPNDVALFTTSGSSTTPIPADIHLSVRATSNDTLDMNQFVLKGTGRVGIGTNDPEYRLDVAGDINASGLVRSNGIALTSDVRLKRNIINTQYGLSTIMKLRPVEYEKKNSIKDNEYNRHEIGFIAQEIAKVLPGLVTEGKDADKTLAVSYTELIPVLTKAIQEQQAAIEALQAENKALKENKVVTVQLMERVKQMEQMLGLNEMELGAKVAGK